MSHLLFYANVNTWISLTPAQKFRTYIILKTSGTFLCAYACIRARVNVSLAFLGLMNKSSVSCAQGVYWPVANMWFMAGGRSIISRIRNYDFVFTISFFLQLSLSEELITESNSYLPPAPSMSICCILNKIAHSPGMCEMGRHCKLKKASSLPECATLFRGCLKVKCHLCWNFEKRLSEVTCCRLVRAEFAALAKNDDLLLLCPLAQLD